MARMLPPRETAVGAQARNRRSPAGDLARAFAADGIALAAEGGMSNPYDPMSEPTPHSPVPPEAGTDWNIGAALSAGWEGLKRYPLAVLGGMLVVGIPPVFLYIVPMVWVFTSHVQPDSPQA